MALSDQTELLNEDDVKAALGGDASVPAGDITSAVRATKAYVMREHSEASVTVGDVVTWPWDYKLGATKLAAGLVRGGFSAAVGGEVGDGYSMQALARLTDVEIEQLLRMGRFTPPRIG